MLPDTGEECIDAFARKGLHLRNQHLRRYHCRRRFPHPWLPLTPPGPPGACFASAMRAPIPSTSCLQPFTAALGTFATLLAHSYLSIWLSQIVQPPDPDRTFVRRPAHAPLARLLTTVCN